MTTVEATTVTVNSDDELIGPKIAMPLTRADLRSLPKVSLHDHLDGALRAATLIELAHDLGLPLPDAARRGPAALADWFFEAASSGSLPRYLETFEHTVAVLQTPAALSRVAREYVLDLAADGVVYGETRWAPQQHTAAGMTMADAVQAVASGLAAGMADVRAAGSPIVVRQLLCSMRHDVPTTAIAELVVRGRDAGVAGFDIAGAEDGFPARRFRPAFELIHAAGLRATAHAGEAYGVPSVRQAVMECGADRIGHGVRIIEDIELLGGQPRLGEVAAFVRDRRIPLEVCPTSNVQTGLCADIAHHPIGMLADLGFVVTVNCDNRLQSRTTLTEEFARLVDAFGYGIDVLERFTVDAARAAFWDDESKERLIRDVIRPGFAACPR